MTTTLSLTPPVNPAPDTEALTLRPSTELQYVPPPRPLAASSPSTAASATPVVDSAHAEPETTPPPGKTGSGTTWLLVGAAMLGGLGWMVERRRRRSLEIEKDSVMWADVQPPGASIITTAKGLSDILPDSPNPAEAARAIYVTAITETTSRREATLIDLHQLDGKLARRRQRGDVFAAVLLLQQHLVDFRYTSPWAFLELRELYKLLDRENEWEIARRAFRHRFGQNAPAWDAPSTDTAMLLQDEHLSGELCRHWPARESRMFMLRWMLGEQEMRQKCSGPPLLELGVYRDLLFLDELLDDVMAAKPALADSLL